MVHIARVKGSDWSVYIGGFKGVVVGDVDGLLGRVGETVSPHIFQLFDADRVAGWEHLYLAAVNAVKAFEAGVAVSKSLAIEVLLYASCQDQIARAFAILGISPSTERVALLLMVDSPELAEPAFERASRLLGDEDDSVLRVDAEKFKELRLVYSVSNLELEAVGGKRRAALARLLIEKGALLPVRR